MTTTLEKSRTQSIAKGAASAMRDEVLAIVQEAYIYLYPLILMDLTRKQMTNIDPRQSPVGGPANAFTHMRAFPTAEMRVVVRPNFDTLYSSAWIDLTNGPVIISTADTGGRYFMLPMLDMWTDAFAVPGKRTNGTAAANFGLVPPGWQGKLPENIERIDAPTSFIWIIGRTQTNGVDDYEAVHEVQMDLKSRFSMIGVKLHARQNKKLIPQSIPKLNHYDW